jgi:hypothetical protein
MPTNPIRREPTLQVTWPRIVGAQIAAVTRPVRFIDGELEVMVLGEEWAAELREMSERIVQRIGEVFTFSEWAPFSEWAGPLPIVSSILWVVKSGNLSNSPATKVLAFRRRAE